MTWKKTRVLVREGTHGQSTWCWFHWQQKTSAMGLQKCAIDASHHRRLWFQLFLLSHSLKMWKTSVKHWNRQKGTISGFLDSFSPWSLIVFLQLTFGSGARDRFLHARKLAPLLMWCLMTDWNMTFLTVLSSTVSSLFADCDCWIRQNNAKVCSCVTAEWSCDHCEHADTSSAAVSACSKDQKVCREDSRAPATGRCLTWDWQQHWISHDVKLGPLNFTFMWKSIVKFHIHVKFKARIGGLLNASCEIHCAEFHMMWNSLSDIPISHFMWNSAPLNFTWCEIHFLDFTCSWLMLVLWGTFQTQWAFQTPHGVGVSEAL